MAGVPRRNSDGTVTPHSRFRNPSWRRGHQSPKGAVRLGAWPLRVRPIEMSGDGSRPPVGVGLPAVNSLPLAENGMLGLGAADGARLGRTVALAARRTAWERPGISRGPQLSTHLRSEQTSSLPPGWSCLGGPACKLLLTWEHAQSTDEAVPASAPQLPSAR